MQLTNASLVATLALAMGSATAAPAPALVQPSEVIDVLSSSSKPKSVQQQGAQLPLPARTVFQFPEEEKGVWLENLEVAPNGDLFMTTMWPSASLYKLRDPSSPDPQATLVHTFPDAQGLSGITATGERCYAVVAAQYSALTAVVPGSAAIWSIQVPADGSAPVTRKITDLPEGGFLNGATTVPQPADCGCRCNSTVLVSDSFNGQVWRIDTKTGAYDVAAKVPEMDPIEGADLPFGVNGIRIMNGHLYWANSNQLKIFRVAVDAAGAAVAGAPVETVATVEAAFIDDFDVDASGTIWLTTNADNKVLAIRPDGAWEVAVGGAGDMTVAGDSAAKFGRGRADRQTLYVTTSGASAVPVNGTITEPAKVVAIDTSSY